MGVMAYIGDKDEPYISILLAKQHHIENEAFDKLEIDDSINVKVIGKKFEYGDPQITVIGVLNN